MLALAELQRSGLADLFAGIVLTGGASKVVGAQELAERVFKIPVRIGKPECVSGMPDIIHNPIYATGVGLLVYGHKQRVNQREVVINQPGMKSLWSRMKNWFQGNF